MTSETVHILMAVYNGGDHLKEQLDSFETQTHQNWVLIASDDGSRDNSAAHLERFAKRHPRTVRLSGPQNGGAANFLHLIRHLGHMEPAPRWVSFSDQDDVWLPQKIARAQEWLASVDASKPALYCSRSLIADQNLANPKLSVARPKSPGFRNALVQNIAAGNTIVLNPAATDLVLRAAAHVSEVVVHDWWIYQLITGAGGVVLHDDEPGLMYRQHGANQIGANEGWKARFRRIGKLLRGDFRAWNTINIAALAATAEELTAENKAVLNGFAHARQLPLIQRLRALRKLQLYRQSGAGTLALWVAAMLRRI